MLKNQFYYWMVLLGLLGFTGCRSTQTRSIKSEEESSLIALQDQVGKLKTEIALVQDAKEKESITINTIKNLAEAFEIYGSDHGFPPENDGFLEAFIQNDDVFVREYLQKMGISIADGWGNPLLIQSKKNGDYWIASSGSDGRFDGFEQKGIYVIESLEDFSKDIIYFASSHGPTMGFSFHPQFKEKNDALSPERRVELQEKIIVLKKKNEFILTSREYSVFFEMLKTVEMDKIKLDFAIELIKYLKQNARQAYRIVTFSPRAIPDDLPLTRLSFDMDAITIDVAAKTDELLAAINGKLQELVFFSLDQAKRIEPGLQVTFNYQRNFKKKKSGLAKLQDELLEAQMHKLPDEAKIRELEDKIESESANRLYGVRKRPGNITAELETEMEIGGYDNSDTDPGLVREKLRKLEVQLRDSEASKIFKKVDAADDLEKEYEDLDRQLRIYEHLKEKISKIQEEVTSNKTILREIQGILPPSAELDPLLKKIELIALKSNIKVEAITPAKEVAAEFHNELRIELTAHGQWADWQKFLDLLSKLKRLLTIYRMDLSAPGNDIRKSLVKATCVITAYYSPMMR